ncbi:MAG TPA: M28 family peptidase [Ardenticatenaceae bacterium]|nr:M28 family peptidase [Ardenticatenaceae bacterium]
MATETPTLAPTVAAVGMATATEAAANATATPQAGNSLFDGEGALAFAEAQCEIGPRPTGSEALLRTRDFIKQQLEPQGWTLVEQDFTYQEVPIHNLLAIKGEGEPLMVGAHFDTRPRADRDQQFPDQPIIGGNDGASGVAVLLELGRTLEVPEGRQVQLAFFDAEDRGNIDGWPFSVGAGHMASNLVGPRPAAVVVVDMIGDADQQIYREQNSDDALNDVIFGIAAELGYEGQGFYNSERWTIIDDHLPFIEQGIPAIDLIDFDYPAWHTLADTCEQLGAASLERVGRVLEVWLERPVGESYLPIVVVSENTAQTD